MNVDELVAIDIHTHAETSTRVTRALLLAEPPSIDSGEITDKGSINQRAVLQRRAALVEALYAEPPAAEVLIANCTQGDSWQRK